MTKDIKSIFITLPQRNLPKDTQGTIITREILEVKRPGTGIGPRFFDIVIGRKARMDISRDTVLQWDMV